VKISSFFIKFLVVGGTTFVGHTALIYLLVHGFGFWDLPSYAVSFVLAVTATWLGNRWLTFQVQAKPTWQDYFRYVRGILIGALMNMTTFMIITHLIPPMTARLLIGTAGGTLVGLFWNYRFMRRMWVKGQKKS
jgi:putative flippase GtrA